MHDLVIIGAGPAGMAAAMEARSLGLDVVVLDEQAQPGGQIYRAVETAQQRGGTLELGQDYRAGLELIAAFRACGARYLPGHQVWQVERDGAVYASDGRQTRMFQGRRILICVGAVERPVPIPGWTLPGVMSVGAAQIIQKTTGYQPGEGIWIGGSGPLAFYYAATVISAGGRIAGFLDTTPSGTLSVARAKWRSLASGWRDALKGLGYIARMRRGVDRYVKGVERIEALGQDRIEAIRWHVGGRWHESPARGLLLHEGVIPHTHMTVSLGCAHHWDEQQQCFRPTTDACGQTDQDTILVAGDCAGIAGAQAAQCRGRLAAQGAARALGRIEQAEFDKRFATTRAALQGHEALRPFLDAMYRPSAHLQAPDDDVLVCRCEGISARMIRDAVEIGARGPNQAKAYTRCGMGPCQGRMCGLTVTTTIAQAAGISPQTVGGFRIRPPLKPLSLGELASLARTGQAE